MSVEKVIVSEEKRQEVKEEFTKTMVNKFKSSEAEGISFTLGTYAVDYGVGIIFTVDDGNLDCREAKDQQEITECNIYLCANLEVFQRVDRKEIVLSELIEIEGEEISLGGDIGLIYELFNIFDLPA